MSLPEIALPAVQFAVNSNENDGGIKQWKNRRTTMKPGSKYSCIARSIALFRRVLPRLALIRAFFNSLLTRIVHLRSAAAQAAESSQAYSPPFSSTYHRAGLRSVYPIVNRLRPLVTVMVKNPADRQGVLLRHLDQYHCPVFQFMKGLCYQPGNRHRRVDRAAQGCAAIGEANNKKTAFKRQW